MYSLASNHKQQKSFMKDSLQTNAGKKAPDLIPYLVKGGEKKQLFYFYLFNVSFLLHLLRL